MDTTAYYLAEPHSEVEFIDVESYDTVVQKVTDYPVAQMADVFDKTYSTLFPLLAARGIAPVGPAFALYHRLIDELATFEVGIPVDRPLEAAETTDSGVVIEPSKLPGGTIARISHFGPYDKLGEAWESFMEAVTVAGRLPDLPFWEFYITEPGPDVDPATLRTDLVTKIRS
jgi:effector-binding domain-containing protein